MKKLCFLCRNIFDKKNIWSRSRILKVSVSVVSVLNGMVSVSDDEVPVSDGEAETPSLVPTDCKFSHEIQLFL